jgi:outer membrane biosynthesis protein TonB
MSASAASDVYAHVLAFLVANGLPKTAKVFRKETGVDEPGDLDVLAMYDAYLVANPPEPKKKKKRARAVESAAEPAAPEEAPPAKKAKKVAPASPEVKTKASPKAAAAKSPKKSPKSSPKAAPLKVNDAPPKEKEAPTRFRRVESEKWETKIKDDKLRITAHKDKGGDSWGDKAAEDLLKVKGKDFRKEMAKKKKASWRGGGAIDQGVNSIKFDSDSE